MVNGYSIVKSETSHSSWNQIHLDIILCFVLLGLYLKMIHYHLAIHNLYWLDIKTYEVVIYP